MMDPFEDYAAYEADILRKLIVLLRLGVATPHAQNIAADMLEQLAFPKEHKEQRRRDKEQTWLSQRRVGIDERTEHWRKKGVTDSTTRAEEDVAAKMIKGKKSDGVEGLRKRLQRYQEGNE